MPKTPTDGRLRRRPYNEAAKLGKWFVLRDLDNDADCPGDLVGRLLPVPSCGMCFRISMKAVEAWLLADRAAIAQFLGVPISRIPSRPDESDDPKSRLVAIARRSRTQSVRADIVPSGRTVRVGPGYTARISEFSAHHWRPGIAAQSSPSLARCLNALARWKSVEVSK